MFEQGNLRLPSEFEKFQWSEQRSQAIFCQPSPFRPFWGCQNGHSTKQKALNFGGSAYRIGEVETNPPDLRQLLLSPKTTSHHWHPSFLCLRSRPGGIFFKAETALSLS
jgi:hypothetical protein